MTRYVAAIDQGTTSTRCMLFDHAGAPVGVHQLEHKQIYPQPGRVEHDPLEIWTRTQQVIEKALAQAEATATMSPAVASACARAFSMACCVRVQISMGSCSTRPGWG